MIDLSRITGFDWNEGNARKNDKHSVTQAEAEEIFFNQPLLLLDDLRHREQEVRFHALGTTLDRRLLHVTFTLRSGGTAVFPSDDDYTAVWRELAQGRPVLTFSDTDPAHAGADSMGLLAQVVAMVAGAGWRPANVDCAVVCETPRLAPYRGAMQDSLSAVVGAPVTVKGNRAEKLGALGRSEGIACWAVALVVR